MSSSLFGGSAAQQPFIGGHMGQGPNAGQSGGLAGTNSQSLSGTSKFNDLSESTRSVIESIDGALRSQAQVADELKTFPLGQGMQRVSSALEQHSVEATAVASLLAQDVRATADLRSRLERDLTTLTKVNTLIEGCTNPQAKASAAKAVAGFPHEYFSQKAEEFHERLALYDAALNATIVPTLRAQHASFMALASAVAALDLELKKIKDSYRTIWRAKTGSVQDPFRHRDGLEITLSGVTIR
ncbi:Nucleoporin nup49/NSP49 (Nuclear pore protein nup49/NSP49) [Microbotryomycetes sp. JL221]|nr:Nucleoporin nup49/NSP49 (Nuclear pore protein nup49/NSP49) [Microbotryomycetes sp. JL221]